MILVDNGYDVWIANTRGTRYSRCHEFWNWTWDDLITHDLPTSIVFILHQTSQKVHYTSHSLILAQGTLVALASFPGGEQVAKVKLATLLSPIAYLSHMTSALGIVASRSFVGEPSRVKLHKGLVSRVKG
ncbi:hypothetical protein OROMI_011453 [Orobanche minor]